MGYQYLDSPAIVLRKCLAALETIASGGGTGGGGVASEVTVSGAVSIRTASTTITATPTLAVAGAYAAGDCVGTVFDLGAFLSVDAGSGVLSSLAVIDKGNEKAALTLVLFSANPTAGTFTDNATPVFSTSIASVLGTVPIAATDYVEFADAGGSGTPYSVATVRNVNLTCQAAAASKHLYGLLVSAGTPTYAAGDVTLRMGFLLD